MTLLTMTLVTMTLMTMTLTGDDGRLRGHVTHKTDLPFQIQ